MSFLTGDQREPDPDQVEDTPPQDQEGAEPDTEPATADTATEPAEPGGDIQAGRGGYADPAAERG